jgi:hypothetical protein
MPPVSREPFPPGASIESLRHSIEALVAARQDMRERRATRSELEANRNAIVRLQQHLSAALISERWDLSAAQLAHSSAA